MVEIETNSTLDVYYIVYNNFNRSLKGGRQTNNLTLHGERA